MPHFKAPRSSEHNTLEATVCLVLGNLLQDTLYCWQLGSRRYTRLCEVRSPVIILILLWVWSPFSLPPNLRGRSKLKVWGVKIKKTKRRNFFDWFSWTATSTDAFACTSNWTICKWWKQLWQLFCTTFLSKNGYRRHFFFAADVRLAIAP